MGSRFKTYIEVLGVDFAVFRQIEVLLCHKNTLCSVLMLADAAKLCFFLGGGGRRRNFQCLPRKRYSWIFLRSALGISLQR